MKPRSAASCEIKQKLILIKTKQKSKTSNRHSETSASNEKANVS